MEKILEKIKEERRSKAVRFLLLFMISLFFTILLIKNDSEESLYFIIATIVLFLFTIRFYFKYRYPEENKLFYRLNKIGSPEKICRFFENQLKNKVAEDEKIIITPKLLIVKNKYENTLVNEEILDITHFTQKANGIIEYVCILLR